MNLKQFNHYILYRRFKMQPLRSILGCIREGDLLQSVDLREAYLHVPIHPVHHKYLCFAYANRHFQYRAMPFGLSSAPQMFTKLLVAVAATVHMVPVCMLCYLDDILILSSSPSQAAEGSVMVIHILQSHGFTLNLVKSHLQPTTRILHLEAVIDSMRGQVYLSPDCQHSIKGLVIQILSQRSVPLLLLLQLLGKMISCIAIVPWARRHACPLQCFLLPFQKRGHSNSRAKVAVPSRIHLSLC